MERVLVEGTVKEARAPEANNIAQGSKTGPCPFNQNPRNEGISGLNSLYGT